MRFRIASNFATKNITRPSNHSSNEICHYISEAKVTNVSNKAPPKANMDGYGNGKNNCSKHLFNQH